MSRKRILSTSATDRIGRQTQELAAQGHELILEDRNPAKLSDLKRALSQAYGEETLPTVFTRARSLRLDHLEINEAVVHAFYLESALATELAPLVPR